MRPLVLLLACLTLTVSFSSCKVLKFFKKGEYTPEYLKEDSPLDPPGTAAARAAMRAKYLKEGVFPKGSHPEVNGGKILMCNRNPEREADTGARLVETMNVKVIACEGLYYFVEAEGGERGFVRESDLVDPNAIPLVPVGMEPDGPIIPGDGDLLPGGEDDGAGVELGGNQRLMKDSDGRNVIVTDKRTNRSSEFEARERALQGGKQLQGGDDDNEPLPESSLDRH